MSEMEKGQNREGRVAELMGKGSLSWLCGEYARGKHRQEQEDLEVGLSNSR